MLKLAQPQIIKGPPIGLEAAIYSLLPETGSVEVQRDTPLRAHTTHAHQTDEVLLVVGGAIEFTFGEVSEVCESGDRLILPANTRHSSVAFDKGCIYIIAIS